MSVSLQDNGVDAAAVLLDVGPDRDFVRFPVDGGRQATIVVVPRVLEGTRDQLLPESHSFEFGADLRYDGDPAAPSGKGNNVMQRGGFSSDQYKIQLDRGNASCRIAGDAGAVVVPPEDRSTAVPLEPGRWYEVRCAVEREEGDPTRATVRLSVRPTDDPDAAREEVVEQALLGAVRPADAPIEVGGRRPVVAGDNDQFEGSISRVLVRVER